MRISVPFALAILLALPAAAAPRRPAKNAGPQPPGPMVHWDCDAAVGAAAGLVAEKSPSGGALGGFADEATRLAGPISTAKDKFRSIPRAWTFQCFVRDPRPREDRPALVARFEAAPAAAGEAPGVAWQLWIERSGALCLGVEDAKGVRSVARHAGAPWRPGVWHHIAIVRELGDKDVDGTREDRYRVWVVPVPPAGAPASPAAAPEPLIDHRLVTKAGPFVMENLAVGGGAAGQHPETAPGGALGGVVDEVSLWDRAFSPEELAAARDTFRAGGSPTAVAAAADAAALAETLLHWSCDEPGLRPVAADSSGRGCVGRSAERVRGGAVGRTARGKSFEGFTTEGSRLVSGPLPEDAFRKDWSLLLWVRNPRLSSKQACVVASADADVRKGSIPWRLWFDSKGAPHVGAQDGSSRSYTGAGEPVRFEPGKWYLVALTHRRGPTPQGGVRDFFQVFAVPEGSRATPAPALDWSYGGAQLAKGSTLLVGAAPVGKGKRAEIAPMGWFGGQIGEVLFLGGAALDGDQIAARAKMPSLGD